MIIGLLRSVADPFFDELEGESRTCPKKGREKASLFGKKRIDKLIEVGLGNFAH